MKAPTPDTFFVVKLKLSGPLPLTPVSAVQIRLSPVLNPVLESGFQLHRVSGQTTATRLFGPVRITEPAIPPVDVKLGVAPSTVASTPSCDHTIVSLALSPPRLVTTLTVSARAAALARTITASAATNLAEMRLYIDAPTLVRLPTARCLNTA